MFVRCKGRVKDGKEHRYWSVVESVRIVQRRVLYLGEINDNQRAAWCRSIEVVEGKSRSRQMALFPEDRKAPAFNCEVVKISVAEVALHDARQWGGVLAGAGLVGALRSGPLLGSAPAAEPARHEVADGGINEANGDRDVGDVCDPELVRPVGRNLVLGNRFRRDFAVPLDRPDDRSLIRVFSPSLARPQDHDTREERATYGHLKIAARSSRA